MSDETTTTDELGDFDASFDSEESDVQDDEHHDCVREDETADDPQETPMIPQSLLTAKGTINALFALADEDNQTTVGLLASQMNVSESTARNRLDQLADLGIVTEDADLIDDRPTRVYEATEDGQHVAELLAEITRTGETEGPSDASEVTDDDADADSDADADADTDGDETDQKEERPTSSAESSAE